MKKEFEFGQRVIAWDDEDHKVHGRYVGYAMYGVRIRYQILPDGWTEVAEYDNISVLILKGE